MESIKRRGSHIEDISEDDEEEEKLDLKHKDEIIIRSILLVNSFSFLQMRYKK